MDNNDLLLKMSKKIAQLTKVIFLLNTKNEDAASELSVVTLSHRRENEALAKEASAKMMQLKDAIAKKDEMLKGMESLKKIKERHQAEKAEAFAQFQQYKEDMKAQRGEAEAHFQKEIQRMTSELKKAKAAFQERIQAFTDILKQVQTNAASGEVHLINICDRFRNFMYPL
jgi:hypothetical protein